MEDSAAPIHDRIGVIADAVIVFHDVKSRSGRRGPGWPNTMHSLIWQTEYC